MIRYFLAFLLFTAVANAQTTFSYDKDFSALQKQSADPKSPNYYHNLLARFKANDPKMTDAEVLALLVGRTAQQDYKPDNENFREGILFSINNEGKFQDALNYGSKYLKSNPLSLKGNFAKAQAFKKLNVKDSAAVYDVKWQRILKAMFYSGKGMSVNDPIFALGIADAEEFIAFFIGAEAKSQTRIKDPKGRMLQKWEAVLDHKKNLTVYFMVQHAAEKIKDYHAQE